MALALTLSLTAGGNQAGGDRSTPPAGTPPSTPSAGSAVTPEPSGNAGTPDTIPAATGGSGFSRTISTISDLQPNATVLTDGLSISRNNVPDAAQEAMDWAAQVLN